MILDKCRAGIGLVGLLVVATACEPASILEAREQLGRGGERTIVFALPIIDTVFQVKTLLEDSELDTLANGLLAVEIEPQSVTVGVGDALEFTDLDFDQFVFGYDQMLQTSEVTTSLAVPSPGTGGTRRAPAQGPGQIQFSTPDGSTVVAATIDEGRVVRTIQNSTICDASVTVSLTDDMAAIVADFGTTAVPAGTTLVDSMDVSGTSVSGDVTLNAVADFGVCVPGPASSVSTSVTFRPMTLQSVDLENVNETFTETYDLFADSVGISAVDTVLVESGSFWVKVQNRLPIDLTFDIELGGITNTLGNPLSNRLTVEAADIDSVQFQLTNVTIAPDDAIALATGSAVASAATITSAVVDSAVIVNGVGDFSVQSVWGQLDPADTPELTLDIEEIEEIAEADLDLGDLEDAIDSSTINHATISLTLDNGTGIQAVFTDFYLGVVKLDIGGNVPRDGAGDPVFEVDGGGNPILVAVADSGQATLTLPASGTSSVDLDAAPLVDCLVHLLLDDERAAIVASGDVVVGDGTQARVNRSDSVSVVMGMAVGLDFTIPADGVSFTRNTVQAGLGLDSVKADNLVDILDSASVVTDAVNNTPFGVEVDIAFVGDSLGDDVDIFSDTAAAVLNTITLSAPAVDAQGLVTSPSTVTVSVELTPEQARKLTGEHISATVRARLLPGTGGGGRGAIRATDEIVLLAQARIVLRAGGGGQ